ncbi:hypothetical protein [Acidisphaera sp. L21]|uniref:hypothetical protein n=1 Tax=Acidisphaera sp. L21 TaxID=1641851 RepID=UPI00131CC656|nr:hypothetical protein [Acidisphaera sp. L21]
MNLQTADTHQPTRQRDWQGINSIAEQSGGAFTPAAVRAYANRAKPHYDSDGSWVAGNGLAPHICQPGGKGGKLLIDKHGWNEWLEGWRLSEAAPARSPAPDARAAVRVPVTAPRQSRKTRRAA